MTLSDVIKNFTDIGSALLPFLASLAFVYFVWGVTGFIRAASSEKGVGDAKKGLVWGIVGLFVLFSIWGIISFFKSELKFGGDVGIPQIQF
jgi:hypothetical protein